MAQQAFIAEKPNMGKTINNFITRLQELAEHCDYDEEHDNQVRDHAISHIKDRNLRPFSTPEIIFEIILEIIFLRSCVTEDTCSAGPVIENFHLLFDPYSDGTIEQLNKFFPSEKFKRTGFKRTGFKRTGFKISH